MKIINHKDICNKENENEVIIHYSTLFFVYVILTQIRTLQKKINPDKVTIEYLYETFRHDIIKPLELSFIEFNEMIDFFGKLGIVDINHTTNVCSIPNTINESFINIK